jgi:hypothetical protein
MGVVRLGHLGQHPQSLFFWHIFFCFMFCSSSSSPGKVVHGFAAFLPVFSILLQEDCSAMRVQI